METYLYLLTKRFFCLLYFLIPLIAFSQIKENNSCGTETMPDSYIFDKFYGDNQKLVNILLQNNVNIDENYLQQLETMETLPTMNSKMLKAVSTHYEIPIKACIYRNNNGSGNISQNQVKQVISYLNNIFETNTNITFYLLCDIGLVNNTNYANNGGQYFNDYVANNKIAGAINIHFVINSSWKGRGTWPWDNPNFACAVATEYTLGFTNFMHIANTTAHEIGHTLGLYHTHHPGRRGNKFHLNEQCGDCYQESVNRSKRQGIACISTFDERKCEVNGDFLCDTAGDPGLYYPLRVPASYVLAGCDFDNVSAGTDNWGDAWTPTVENIMDYAPYSCRSVFSPLQVAKMYGYIGDIGITYPTLNISGPNNLCLGSIATYSVPYQSDVTYFWEMPYNMNLISGQGSNSVVVESAGNYGGIIKVTPSCGNRTVTKTILNIQELAIEGYDQACPLFTYTYSAPYISNADYEWTITNGYVVSGQYSNQAQIALTQHPSQQTIINVELTNVCNYSLYGQKTVIHGDPPFPAQQCFLHQDNKEILEDNISFIDDKEILLYPNPASTAVDIIISNREKYNVILFDITGRKLYESDKNIQGNLTIDVQSYPEGIYIIHIVGKYQTISKRLILKK